MNPRLLITGTSHVAAIRQGWNRICTSGKAPVEVDFLAASVGVYQKFERTQDGRFGLFKSKEELGATEREYEFVRDISGEPYRKLSDISHSAYIGHRTGVEWMIEMLQEAGIDGIRTAPPGGTTMSRPAFDTFCHGFIKKHLPLEMMHNLEGTRIGIVAIPFRSELLAEESEQCREAIVWRRAHPDGILKAIERFNALACGIYRQLGLTLFPQPMSTISPIGMTDVEYNRRWTHPGTGETKIDPIHTNEDYGAMCMKELVTWLNSATLDSPVSAKPELNAT